MSRSARNLHYFITICMTNTIPCEIYHLHNGIIIFTITCTSKIQLTTTENTITYHNTLCWSLQNLHKHCLQFLLGVKMAPKETENNAYAYSSILWYVMAFSVVVNSFFFFGNPNRFK